MLDKQSEYIRLIEEEPSLVQVTSSDRYTIFHEAAYYGRLQVMEAINNIDPDMKDRVNELNNTPLMYASHYDQVACVKWLLDHLDHANNQEIEDMIKNK